jgi:hypothetical protein
VTAATPGLTYGAPDLIPLQAGSAGGSRDNARGAPGGALQITSSTSISVGITGAIFAGGLGGDYYASSNGDGAGGGSGSAILLEAPTVTIGGTIAANGGGGGDATNVGTDSNPANGPGAAAGGGSGGRGSAGATVNGAAGSVGTSTYGAGGGGAGHIRINTTSGSATLSAGYILSPSVGTACVTQGAI